MDFSLPGKFIQAILDPNIDLIPGVGNNEADRAAQRKMATTEAYRSNGKIYSKSGDVMGTYSTKNDSDSGGGSDNNPGITYAGNGGGGSVGDAATRGQWEQQVQDLERQLGLLPGQLSAGLRQIGDGYNKGVSRLNQDTGRALSKLETNRADTKEDFNDSLEDNDAASRGNYEAIMALLGRAGARSSSAADILTPHAVSQESSKTRGKLADAYGKNIREIDTAVTDTNESAKRSREDLEDQKRNNEYSLRQKIDSQKAKVLGSLAEAKGNLALAGGQGWEQAKAAMNPALQQKAAIEAAISTLLDSYRNPYSVKPITVKTPTMTNYAADQSGVKVDDPNGPGTDTDTAAQTQAQIAAEEKRKKDATATA